MLLNEKASFNIIDGIGYDLFPMGKKYNNES